MSKVLLLEELKLYTENVTKDILMPVRIQPNGDNTETERKAEVYLQNLPDLASSTKKAPYILHQIVTGKDIHQSGAKKMEAYATVRTVFCVYDANTGDGGMLLLNLVERLRIALLQDVVVGNRFTLSLEDGIETLNRIDVEPPYFIAEMVSVWKLPPIERKVQL